MKVLTADDEFSALNILNRAIQETLPDASGCLAFAFLLWGQPG